MDFCLRTFISKKNNGDVGRRKRVEAVVTGVRVVAGGAGGAGRLAARRPGRRGARHLGIARSLTRTGLTRRPRCFLTT